MGVMMQAFYWDCPRTEQKEFQWWDEVASLVPALSRAGFTAIWLPPANKAANLNGPSMGYDPYDYYDLGSIAQKGSTATWFGTQEQLISLISTTHQRGMQVYADLVLNHNSGADEEEACPVDGHRRWTLFRPGSGKFTRNWQCFHPSRYETWDGEQFGQMPDLCHRNPHVYEQLLEYAQWLLEEIGFDGFRYDCVKGYGGWMVRAIQELRCLREDQVFKPYGVGECWDSDRTIDDWLDETNAWTDNPAGAFDFPLRDRLKALCDSYGYSLKQLADGGVLATDRPLQAVTFVENHDTARSNPIITDKMMAYAVILTHEGYPCVFWEDYYTYGLAQEDTATGIAALVKAHEGFAGGQTQILYVDDDLYIAQRSGHDNQRGLVLTLNNRADWSGARVVTQWPATSLYPIAWHGRGDTCRPADKWTARDGSTELWAPPRGYAVYIPR